MRDLADPAEGVYNATALLGDRLLYIQSMLDKYQKLPTPRTASPIAALVTGSAPQSDDAAPASLTERFTTMIGKFATADESTSENGDKAQSKEVRSWFCLQRCGAFAVDTCNVHDIEAMVHSCRVIATCKLWPSGFYKLHHVRHQLLLHAACNAQLIQRLDVAPSRLAAKARMAPRGAWSCQSWRRGATQKKMASLS